MVLHLAPISGYGIPTKHHAGSSHRYFYVYIYSRGGAYPDGLKQMDRHASLNHNIYIAADPTPVDVDHAAHAGHSIVRP